MKIALLLPLIAVGAFAQIPATPQAPPAPIPGRPEVAHPQPGMPAAPVSPDKEVAKLNGQPMTVADVEKLFADLPPKYQIMVARDPEKLLQQLLVFEELAKQAVDQGLDKEQPYRSELVYARLMTLAQAEVERARNGVKLTPEREQQYYEEHKDDMFRMIKASAIFIGFAPPPPAAAPGAPPRPVASPVGGITRSEADAKTKIDDLRKQITAGADFGKLAKENSDDKVSAAKNGDYGEIIRTSPYPEAIKKVIFAMKPGEVSEPIRQPSGFYLIKVADSSYQALDSVRPQIRDMMVGQEFEKHMKAIQDKFAVTVEDKTYFQTRTPK